MFQVACSQIRESLYGLLAFSSIQKGKKTQVNAGTGTGFMIYPGRILTVAHLAHLQSDVTKPR
jgi:hypothetical protein